MSNNPFSPSCRCDDQNGTDVCAVSTVASDPAPAVYVAVSDQPRDSLPMPNVRAVPTVTSDPAPAATW